MKSGTSYVILSIVCVHDNIGANETPQFTKLVLSEAKGSKNTPYMYLYRYVQARAPRELSFAPPTGPMGPRADRKSVV